MLFGRAQKAKDAPRTNRIGNGLVDAVLEWDTHLRRVWFAPIGRSSYRHSRHHAVGTRQQFVAIRAGDTPRLYVMPINRALDVVAHPL